jgi:hypothetical protein
LVQTTKAVRVGVLVVVVIQRNRYGTVERCEIVKYDMITYRLDVSDRREMQNSMNGEGGKRADDVVVVFWRFALVCLLLLLLLSNEIATER